jgi:hypothetical protein
MIDEADGAVWYSRRDARIRRPVTTLGTRSSGLPHLLPEVQLYYKAKNPRPKDEVDFAAVLPLLTQEQRGWLADAIGLTLGESHPWLSTIRDRS